MILYFYNSLVIKTFGTSQSQIGMSVRTRNLAIKLDKLMFPFLYVDKKSDTSLSLNINT